ncbi:MAG: hypothetical protein COA47_10055 [Robiginitomaculum sp.]|nr:MAG: hypothetical protein COA47_10055 [Robiginitomaculum sp.]
MSDENINGRVSIPGIELSVLGGAAYLAHIGRCVEKAGCTVPYGDPSLQWVKQESQTTDAVIIFWMPR